MDCVWAGSIANWWGYGIFTNSSLCGSEVEPMNEAMNCVGCGWVHEACKCTDSADSFDIDAMAFLGIEQVPYDKAVLIAPNKRVQKDWRKRYPDIEVILVKNHKGYDLPKGYEQVNDLVSYDSATNTSVTNPPKGEANTK